MAWLWACLSSLFSCWMRLISGCSFCIATIERTCLAVSGSITSITRAVIRVMAIPRLCGGSVKNAFSIQPMRFLMGLRSCVTWFSVLGHDGAGMP